MSRSWPWVALPLLSLTTCSRLLDFSEVTGGTGDAATVDAAAEASDGATCSAPTTLCAGQCVNLAQDSNHCGECERDCAGGACVASQCDPYLLADAPGCHSVVIDEARQFAYFTRYRNAGQGDGGIYRVDLATEDLSVVVPNQVMAVWLVLTDDKLFWTTEAPPKAVWRHDLLAATGPPPQLYPDPGSTEEAPFGLSVADGFVYFADRTGRIGRVPVAGDSAEVLYTVAGSPLTLAVLGSFIYYGDRVGTLGAADPPTHAIRRLPVTPPATPETVIDKLHNPWGLVAVDLSSDAGATTHVFTSISNGAAVAIQQPGGGFQSSKVSNAAGVFAPNGADILVLGKQLYWSTRGGVGGSIQTYELGALGAASTLANANTPIGVAQADGLLYWCSFDFGLVRLRL